MAGRKKIDPAAGIKEDPGTSWITHEGRTTTETTGERRTYPRYNIYVPEKEIYEDFAIYAKDIGMNVSALVFKFMTEIVDANREQIEEAKRRHAKAQQKKYE